MTPSRPTRRLVRRRTAPSARRFLGSSSMRFCALCALGAIVLGADPVPDEKAKAALAKFDEAFQARDVEAKQNAVYDLHDVPHDLVLKQLEKLLRHRDPKIRNVAALAVGGQRHEPNRAGEVLMRSYARDFDVEEVLSAVLGAMAELKYMGYWPQLTTAMKDVRTSVVLHALELVGNNRDWRAFPELVEIYEIALPKGKTWSGGEEVTVDTGAEGDADQQAAEAQYNAQSGGRGGGGGGGGSGGRSSVLRNLSTQIEKCAKRITGESFESALDLRAWWAENYVMVAQKIAQLDGKDPESVVPRAKIEQAELRAKVEEERRRAEEKEAKRREKEK